MALALDTRERLLRAGEALARQQGLKALTVRAVTARAEAHLGSFVHHFGTREAFVTELIERRYSPLMASLQLAADGHAPPLDALRQGLLKLVVWLQKNRAFMAQVLLDAAAGEPAARHFLRTLDGRHPALLLGLVLAAQQAGALRRDEPLHQLLFLMSTLALPVLALHLLGKSSFAPPPLARGLAAYAFEPDAAAQRLDWALRGLAPEPEKQP
jgi:AcrR family transcriptional regulator